jgi:asparagine synthase (glutamine-hydrolysing)
MSHFIAVMSDVPHRHGSLNVAHAMASSFRQTGLEVEILPIDNRLAIGHTRGNARAPGGNDWVARGPAHILSGLLALFNRDDITADGRASAGAAACSDMEAVSTLAHRSLKGAAEQLNGDFSLLRYSPSDCRLELARDHLGHCPLYYARSGGLILISTSVPPLIASGMISHDLNEQALAYYVALGAALGSTSYYRDISCVPPGCTVEVKAGRIGNPERFWHPEDVDTIKYRSVAEADESISHTVTRAIVSRVAGTKTTGVRLSGGLDSALVAAVLCGALPDRKVIAVSTVLPEGHTGPEQDERRYVESLSRLYPNLHVSFDDAHGCSVLDGAEDHQEWLAAPVCLHDYFAGKSILREMQRQDVEVCLTGFGGDQFLSADGEGYLPETLLSGKLRDFKSELGRIKRSSGSSMPRVLYSEVLAALAPHWLATFKRRLAQPHPFHGTALRSEFVTAAGLEDHARERGYLKSLHRPRSMRESHLGYLQNVTEWPMHGIAGMIGDAHGIEVRSPLLDRHLIEDVLSVPSHFKVSPQEGRCLIRRTFADILPEDIRHRSSKGSPFPDHKARLRREIPFIRKRFADFRNLDLWNRMIDLQQIERGLSEVKDTSSWEVSFNGLQKVIRPYFLGEFLERYEQ